MPPCGYCPSCQCAAAGKHCRLPQISGLFRAVPCSKRGALRDRHECWARDAMDAAARETKALMGRRSRVVLAPRRWCQVGDDASHPADDGGNKAQSPGRARRKPLKPSRRECRSNGLTCGDFARVLVSFAREAAGAADASGIPCALSVRGTLLSEELGQDRVARTSNRAVYTPECEPHTGRAMEYFT
jgi:hypothetical protein